MDFSTCNYFCIFKCYEDYCKNTDQAYYSPLEQWYKTKISFFTLFFKPNKFKDTIKIHNLFHSYADEHLIMFRKVKSIVPDTTLKHYVKIEYYSDPNVFYNTTGLNLKSSDLWSIEHDCGFIYIQELFRKEILNLDILCIPYSKDRYDIIQYSYCDDITYNQNRLIY